MNSMSSQTLRQYRRLDVFRPIQIIYVASKKSKWFVILTIRDHKKLASQRLPGYKHSNHSTIPSLPYIGLLPIFDYYLVMAIIHLHLVMIK